MLKRVDIATYNAIKQTGEGSFVTGPQVFGLAEDGLDYSKSNTEALTQDIIDQMDAAQAGHHRRQDHAFPPTRPRSSGTGGRDRMITTRAGRESAPPSSSSSTSRSGSPASSRTTT